MGGDAMTTPMPDVAEIRRALSLFLEPGQVAELRVLHTRRGTLSGYFNDFEHLARDAATAVARARQFALL